MPFLVQTLWNGDLHHSIDTREPERAPERLGRETARLQINDREAAQGIDALVRLNFPEIAQAEAPYHGA